MNISISDKSFESTKQEISIIIKNITSDNNIELADSIINNVAIHLAIAIIRLKSNNYIPLSQSQINSYKKNDNYKTAKIICTNLSQKYNIEFPVSEVALLSMYLSKMNTLDFEFNSGFDLLDNDVYIIIQNAINNIYVQTGIDFLFDEKLQIALGLHLTPALDRLMNDDQIENPLLDKIKDRYSDAYNMGQILNDVVNEFYQKRFSDDETAYFALHFAVSMKHNKNKIQA